MSVKPLRDFVVVSKDDAPRETASGLYLAPSVEDKMVTGTVLAVGSGRVAVDGSVVAMEVKTGDKVAFNKHMATELKVKGETVLVIKEDQILCVVS